jgi:hypothetical protein
MYVGLEGLWGDVVGFMRFSMAFERRKPPFWTASIPHIYRNMNKMSNDSNVAPTMTPLVILPTSHPVLSKVTPVCTNLPEVEEEGLMALDVQMIRKFWPHFCPDRCPMHLRHTQRESTGKRQPCLKEFACCGTAALICFAHEGELVFAMGGRHDGLYMETPVPFKLKLKGPGPGGSSTAAPSQLQQSSTSEMQEHEQQQQEEEVEEQTQQKHHEDHEEDEDEEEQKEPGHKVRMSSSTVHLHCDGVNNEDDEDEVNEDDEDDEDDDDEQPSGAGSAPTIDGGSVPGTASTNGSERNVACATIPHLSERGPGQRSAEFGNAKVSAGGSGSGSDTAQSCLEDDPLGHTDDDSSDRSADDESYAQDAKETAEVFHDAVEAEDAAFDGGGGGDQEPAPPTTTSSSSSSGLLSVSGNVVRPDAAPSSSLRPVPGQAPSSQGTSSPLPEPAPSSSLALGGAAAAAAGTPRPRRRRRDHDEGDTPNTGPSAGAESLHPPAARDGMHPGTSEAAAATATMGQNSKKARK